MRLLLRRTLGLNNSVEQISKVELSDTRTVKADNKKTFQMIRK